VVKDNHKYAITGDVSYLVRKWSGLVVTIHPFVILSTVVVPEVRFCEARNEPTKPASPKVQGLSEDRLLLEPWIPDIHEFSGCATIYEFRDDKI
jgi:hypothetical protein